uniref:Uncharacterized protein LOC113792276 n=1 Tax=Dermatophagoides pteronyssinus TaxID=6956 RepID=A0A6P6Y124_DERPT
FDGDGDGGNLSKVNNHHQQQQCLINFIKFIAHNRSKLEHLLPKDFLAKRWKEILHTNSIESNDCIEFKQHIDSKSGWKKLFKSEEQFQNFKIISDKMFQTDEKMMKKFDNCDRCIDTIDLLLNPILESIIDSNEWQNYLNECLILFREHYTDLSKAKFYIHILMKMVQETTMDSKQKTQILNENFSDLIEIMLLITFLVNNKLMITTIDNMDYLQQLKLKILEFSHHSLERFIRFDMITNQHLFLIYNLCIEMNIFAYCSSNGSIGLYCDLFDRIQMIIQLILSKRPYLAFESMCTGRTILRTNIASLIRITSDRKQFGNATDTDKIRLEQCSKSIQQSVNRLIQFLEFQPYVQSMIIDYLELLLHNTPIDLRIKENLQQSIYQLIDYLIKQNNGKKNLENLYSRLNEKSKELFRKLLDYHDHYYRFKGYV